MVGLWGKIPTINGWIMGKIPITQETTRCQIWWFDGEVSSFKNWWMYGDMINIFTVLLIFLLNGGMLLNTSIYSEQS